MTGQVPSMRPRVSFVERLDPYERLLRLDKPIGTLLLLWPTLSALWLATRGQPTSSLLAINLIWVVAYDTEYAMVDRDDDAKIGIRTSALTFGRSDIAAVALCYAVYLAAMAWIGRVHALGWPYAAGLAIALAIAIHHLWIIRRRERDACFRAFLGNHWLGLAIFAGIALDYALRAGRWPRAW